MYFKSNKMSDGWNLNDFTTSLPPNVSPFFSQVERIYWLIQCTKSVYGTPTLA